MRSAITGSMLAIAGSVCGLGPIALHGGASGPTVNGAGSTWVQIALDQWRADIAQQGFHINYQGVGSSAGRQAFTQGTADFAASEIPYQPNETRPSRAFEYFPDVAGGTALMYQLHAPDGSQVKNLRLNADAAARIFTGAMTSWQDSEIKALNPGLSIRETTIVPVPRSDGSGTSAQFSLYLASQAPSVWNPFATSQGCPAPCSNWPPVFPTAQNGSDQVAQFVADASRGPGSIGYVEAGYAQGYNYPVAALHNAAGNYVLPTAVNVATALQHAAFNGDNTQNLNAVYVSPEPNAYPMSSYSYLIAQTSGFDPAKGAVFGTWLIYIACGGQREAAPLGYSPLPPVLIQNMFDAIHKIPGAPATPPIDRVNCPNPTLANAPGAPVSAVSITQFGAGSSTAGGGDGHGSGTGGGGDTSPAASASATASAIGGPSASASVSASASGVKTLGAAQRQAAFLAAEQAALRAQPGPAVAFIVAGVVILCAVFAPVLLGWRRAARDLPPENVDG